MTTDHRGTVVVVVVVVRSHSLPALDLAFALCLGLVRDLERNGPGVVWAEGKVAGG